MLMLVIGTWCLGGSLLSRPLNIANRTIRCTFLLTNIAPVSYRFLSGSLFVGMPVIMNVEGHIREIHEFTRS